VVGILIDASAGYQVWYIGCICTLPQPYINMPYYARDRSHQIARPVPSPVHLYRDKTSLLHCCCSARFSTIRPRPWFNAERITFLKFRCTCISVSQIAVKGGGNSYLIQSVQCHYTCLMSSNNNFTGSHQILAHIALQFICKEK
jgi:hypothetical protein